MNYAGISEYCRDKAGSQFRRLSTDQEPSTGVHYRDTAWSLQPTAYTPYSSVCLISSRTHGDLPLPAVKDAYYWLMLTGQPHHNYGYLGQAVPPRKPEST